MDGKTLDKAGVEALAKMPSLDELRGKLVGLVQAPAAKSARVLQAPAGKIARQSRHVTINCSRVLDPGQVQAF